MFCNCPSQITWHGMQNCPYNNYWLMFQKIKSNLPKTLIVREGQGRVQPSRQAQILYNKLATAKIDSLLLVKEDKTKRQLYRYSPNERRDELELSAFYGTQIKFKSKSPMRYTSFSNREQTKRQPQSVVGKPITPLEFLDVDFNNRFRYLVDSERYRYQSNAISELKRGVKLSDGIAQVRSSAQPGTVALKIDEKVINNIRGVHRSHLLKRQEELKIKLGREMSAEQGYCSPKIVNLSYEFRPKGEEGQVLGGVKLCRENRFQSNFKNKSKLQKKYRSREIEDELQFEIQLIERDEFKIKKLMEEVFKDDHNVRQN